MKYINYREERNHGTIDFPIEFIMLRRIIHGMKCLITGTSNMNLFVF